MWQQEAPTKIVMGGGARPIMAPHAEKETPPPTNGKNGMAPKWREKTAHIEKIPPNSILSTEVSIKSLVITAREVYKLCTNTKC